MEEGPRQSRRAFLRNLLLGAAGVAVAGAGVAFVDHKAPALKGLPLPDPPGPVLVLAPHPDDETLGSGGRWHWLLERGHDVHVVVVTMGDCFRVDAEEVFQTYRLNPHLYRALGEKRRLESEAACRLLGLPSGHLAFLGFPDGYTEELFLNFWRRTFRDPRTATDRDPYGGTLFPGIRYRGKDEFRAFKTVLRRVQPRTLILPHPYDHHPDHWATNAFATLAVEALRLEGAPFAQDLLQLLYLVHWPNWPAPEGYDPTLPLLPPPTLAEARTAWYPWKMTRDLVHLKHEAILQYRTQMLVMSGRLLAFARADELFGIVSPYLIGFFPGHWSGVPPAIVAPGSWSTLFYNGDARPTDEVQVARQGDRLLLRLVPALPIPHERVVLSLTLVHPSFPDGVRRLTVAAAGHEVRGFREGAGRLRGGEGRSLDDGSHVLSLPMSWLSPAENFLLIASFRTAAGTVSRTPGRLLRLRLPDAAGLLR